MEKYQSVRTFKLFMPSFIKSRLSLLNKYFSAQDLFLELFSLANVAFICTSTRIDKLTTIIIKGGSWNKLIQGQVSF